MCEYSFQIMQWLLKGQLVFQYSLFNNMVNAELKMILLSRNRQDTN